MAPEKKFSGITAPGCMESNRDLAAFKKFKPFKSFKTIAGLFEGFNGLNGLNPDAIKLTLYYFAARANFPVT